MALQGVMGMLILEEGVRQSVISVALLGMVLIGLSVYNMLKYLEGE